MLIADGGGILRFVNRQTERLFGYRREELLGGSVDILLPERFRKRHGALRAGFLERPSFRPMGTGEPLLARRKGGAEVPVDISLSPIQTDDGVFVAAAIRDATQRVRATRTLEDARDRLADVVRERTAELDSIFRTARIVMLVLSPKAEVLEWNAEAERVYGWAREEVLGRDYIRSFLPERIQPDARREFERILAGGESKPYENPVTCRDGSERIMLWHSSLLFDAKDRVIGLVGCGQDVTEVRLAERERARLEHELREQGRLADIGALATRLGHDLGNTTTCLAVQAQLLKRRADEGRPAAELREHCELLLASIKSQQELLGGLRELARGQRLELQRVNLVHLVGEAVAPWRDVAEHRDVPLVTVFDERLPEPVADPVKLRRVVENLVKNALEATEPGAGRVILRAAAPDTAHVRISVADEGAGLPDDFDGPRMFASTKSGGTGLGLTICREIVAAHAGSLSFERLTPRGTAAHVDLPVRGPVS
jgi:PAS domain S-box-containing protein